MARDNGDSINGGGKGHTDRDLSHALAGQRSFGLGKNSGLRNTPNATTATNPHDRFIELFLEQLGDKGLLAKTSASSTTRKGNQRFSESFIETTAACTALADAVWKREGMDEASDALTQILNQRMGEKATEQAVRAITRIAENARDSVQGRSV